MVARSDARGYLFFERKTVFSLAVSDFIRIFAPTKHLKDMVTDSIIKKKFIHERLQKGLAQIYSEQEQTITAQLDTRTGNLRTWASRRQYDMRISSSGDYTVNVRFAPYLRFLDMMYRGRRDRVSKYKRSKLRLYNRVIWGVLYRRTFPSIRFGFTDEVRQNIRKKLERTFN